MILNIDNTKLIDGYPFEVRDGHSLGLIDLNVSNDLIPENRKIVNVFSLESFVAVKHGGVEISKLGPVFSDVGWLTSLQHGLCSAQKFMSKLSIDKSSTAEITLNVKLLRNTLLLDKANGNFLAGDSLGSSSRTRYFYDFDEVKTFIGLDIIDQMSTPSPDGMFKEFESFPVWASSTGSSVDIKELNRLVVEHYKDILSGLALTKNMGINILS